MKASVLGWYSKQNIGDEAFTFAFPLFLPHVDFTFSNYLSHSNADAVILGGGDVMQRPFLKQLEGIQKPLYAISVNASDQLDDVTAKRFKKILVREYHSLKTLQDKGIDAEYMPDLAFLLEGNKENGKRLIKHAFQVEERDHYSKVVSVIINCHLFSDSDRSATASDQFTFLKFCYDLAAVIDNTNASFLFIPFCTSMPWDDRIANAVVMSKCKFWKKNVILYKPPQVRETLDMIAASDAVISSRLHSSIFSTASCVPFIDITHNHKNQWFLETINKTEWSCHYRRFDLERCKNLLNNFLSSPNEHISALRSINKMQREIITQKAIDVHLL